MLSVKYHKIFDYDLVKSDFPKWRYKDEVVKDIKSKKSKLRLKREEYSEKKLKIANKASGLISKIPSVLFVGVTGSLAMMNATQDSDIDLIIVTKQDSLWITRPLVHLVLFVHQMPVRRGGLSEKNRICLNMWMDESDLDWPKYQQNIYSSHEIAQIIPLANKNKIYESFLYLNKWILNYWPNSVRIDNRYQVVNSKLKQNLLLQATNYMLRLFEILAFKLQYLYMKRKMTCEVVTPTRALFHPTDWGKKVLQKLN